MKLLFTLLFAIQLLFACEPTITCDSSVTVYNDTSFQIEWKAGAFVALVPYYYITVGYADTLPTFAGAMDSVAIRWLREGCYRISLSGCNQCTSSIIVHWYDVPLPVELLSFRAEPSSDCIILYWEVARESEDIYYQLFRNGVLISTDMPGGQRSYEYIDRTAQRGQQHEYSLACVEPNGQRRFLDSTTVFYGNEAQLSQPSMECDAGKVTLTLPQSTEVKLVVYNILSQEVAVLADSYFQSGIYHFRFDGSSHPTGIYLVCGNFDGIAVTKKMPFVK